MYSNHTQLNLIYFIALMGSSALTLATRLFFSYKVVFWLSVGLELLIILFFIYFFIIFLWRFFSQQSLLPSFKNPAQANLYSAMPIAAALISLMLLKIGLPLPFTFNLFLASFFWLLSLLLSLIFIILIPISLKFRSQIEQVSGTWFLPPVGLFVLIMAGSTLALSLSHLANLILTINLLILGPAFVLYFLTLTLLYFRSKFYDLSETKIAPTFNIVLAPAGVSIIALIMTSQAMLKYKFLHLASLFSDLTKLYSLVMFGYGLWIVGALLYLYWRIIREKEKIPFSQLWWAFIFPLAAFTLATFNLYHFVLSFEAIKFIYYTLYFILLAIWLLVVYKTFFKHFLNLLLKKSS